MLTVQATWQGRIRPRVAMPGTAGSIARNAEERRRAPLHRPSYETVCGVTGTFIVSGPPSLWLV
jgi:hypothetical protein